MTDTARWEVILSDDEASTVVVVPAVWPTTPEQAAYVAEQEVIGRHAVAALFRPRSLVLLR